ncbi:hypothetical protein V1478_011391, partial [Vespula squamosa]
TSFGITKDVSILCDNVVTSILELASEKLRSEQNCQMRRPLPLLLPLPVASASASADFQRETRPRTF